MTFGDLYTLVQAAERVSSSLRRPTPDALLARLADLADSPEELGRLHANIERLARAVHDCRAIPVAVELREPRP